ncbi:hypothetical protein WJX79_007319 [Trebouxia sp. C0005]
MSSRQGLLGQRDAIGAEAFHILLVEDDELTLKVTEGLLRHCDYQVTLARNGRQALEALQSPEGERINLILTDVLMPEIDGIELMTELLQNEGWSHIPIIVMSSQSSQESVLKAFEAGAKDYLIKPVRRNELATLWQHVWRVNRDMPSAHSLKPRFAPTRVKQYSVNAPNHNMETTVSPLHLLCEVASNEHQACRHSAQQSGQISSGHSAAQLQPLDRTQSALSPIELQIRPLDVHPSQPSATRAAPPALVNSTSQTNGSHHNMPAALRELAALGNKLEKERSKQQPKSSDEDEQAGAGSDAANTLHHSESTSPFQSFTAFVPRPCSRGDAAELVNLNPPSALQQLSLTHEPAREGGVYARLSGNVAGVTVGQQQQFFQAFQAAVEQHQLAVEACAVNRRAAIAKFREKRKARNFNKKVRYESRRRLAETRPRVRGQFVKAGTAASQSIAAQEPAAAQVASHGNGIAAVE